MTQATIHYEVDGPVDALTLNRPNKRNAINAVMRAELRDILASLRTAAHRPRVLILRGSGSNFCAGGDISEMHHAGEGVAESGRNRMMLEYHPIVEALMALPCPVIAAVDGVAYGAGFSLALACDYVVTSDRARFSLSFLLLGLVPDCAALYTLPRLVGPQRAKALMLSTRELLPEEARQVGLVAEVCAHSALHDRVNALARDLSLASPTAASAIKHAVNSFTGQRPCCHAANRGQCTRRVSDYARTPGRSGVLSGGQTTNVSGIKRRRGRTSPPHAYQRRYCELRAESGRQMKITAIETCIVKLPLRRPHKLAMATIHRHTVVVIRLRTSEGIEGVGEVAIIPNYSEEFPAAVKLVIDECLTPRLLGQDPRSLIAILLRMDEAIKGNSYAKAGIEMACVDVAAKGLECPASTLLGGRVVERLPVLWVLGHGEIGADIDEAEAHLAKRMHRMFLVKLGRGTREENVARALAIKKALGDRASVRVDVNQGWDESTAAWAIERLEAGGIDAVEQPVPAWNRGAMRRLAKRFTVPIMADEGVASVEDAMAHAAESAADAFSIKPVKHGGLLRARQIVTIAQAAGISLFGGTMLESSIGTAACAQVFSTVPYLAWGCQLFGPQLLADDLVQEPVQYEDFELIVPKAPGLGIALDEDKLAFYARLTTD